jgi:hypothetical protein
MKPNWDAYAQAHKIQTDQGSHFKINPCQHVKAHQDREKPFEELDWAAKLNFWADEQATIALKDFPEGSQHDWHPFPCCEAYLEVNGKICTAKSIQILEDWVNEQPLHQYYKEHHGWTNETLYSVDWDAYGGASKQFKYNDTAFCTKLCCGWLPTYAKQFQIKATTSDRCIQCNEIEDTPHLFQCKHRSDWKKEFINGLKKLLDKYKTADKVKDGLVDGLDAWLDKRQCTVQDDPQKDIGWEQGFLGFLSHKWGHMQAAYYKKLGEQKLTAKTWGMKVIQYIWTMAKKAWKIRNDIVHDDKDPLVKHRRRTTVEEKVTYLYSLENQMSAFDRDWLAEPLEERLKSRTHELEVWHDETYPIIRECVRDFHERSKKGMKDIRDYFAAATSSA